MKKLLQIAIILTFCGLTTTLTSCRSVKNAVGTRDKTRQSIVILFETDVHCAISDYAKIAGLRDGVADTAWVALVSCGDFLQGGTPGAISRGQYITDIMRSMHYDAVTLGNHEFDYGVPRMRELLDGLNAPVVCCNYTDMQGRNIYAPYTIRNYGGRKVAFVGVLTPYTELKAEWYAFHDAKGQSVYTLHEKTYADMVQQAVDKARSEGADYVVLLSHTGEDFESDPSNHLTSNHIISVTHGIDAVLDGHSHNAVDTLIRNSQGRLVHLANTGAYFTNIGKLWIGAEGQMDITLIPARQVTQVSTAVDAEIQKVKRQTKEQTGRVVMHSDYPLVVIDPNGGSLTRRQQTNAGNLTTDAMRWLMKADIGMITGGSLRQDMKQGDITYDDIINMLPFDNYVIKIQATGAQILEVLRQNTASLPAEDGDFPQVSGLRYNISIADHTITNAEVMQVDGSRISDVEVLQTDGTYAPLLPTATYTVASTDYATINGGFRGLFIGCTVLQTANTLCRDAVVKYVKDTLGGNIGQQYAIIW
jgi:2',3'-cyclic-nucleotide 2'-phosphodiesterase (5'-nucleotidase family)